jgi:hypothetical protein
MARPFSPLYQAKVALDIRQTVYYAAHNRLDAGPGLAPRGVSHGEKDDRLFIWR